MAASGFFPHQHRATQSGAKAQDMESRSGYAIASANMLEAKGFNAHDSSGISLARLGGIITKRIYEAVALRARDLRLEYVFLGQSFKMQAVHEIMGKEFCC
jgi:3-deoxy-D-manno-octulosonate 8-phosphate phosphatase (KDO 8-P phosphatase)